MDSVKCSRCGKHSIPRLWHVRPFLGSLRYMKIQHLCPFCGVCMYESGGQFTAVGKIILLFMLLFFLMPVVQILAR
jgi:hypothetical protein